MKTMNARMAMSTALFSLCAAIALPASAATSYRSDLEMAAGACQPFFSTTQARYSASGLTNGGTATFYVACAKGGFWQAGANQGYSMMKLVVSNPTDASITVNCTGRPGRVYGANVIQGAAPRSSVIAAGSYAAFTWYPADFATTTLANPNFTCTLPVGAVLNWVEAEGSVDVGA